ncbi:MAG: M23 family metallopeptidase [Propionicimonas sp.]|nr:M23 family metallopeptidase [Propionicimonas sp.]
MHTPRRARSTLPPSALTGTARRALSDRPAADPPRRPTRWWRSGLAAVAAAGVSIAAIITVVATTRAATVVAFAGQPVPPPIAQARDQRDSRGGERSPLTVAELADQRAQLLEDTSRRVQDGQQQAALDARQNQFAEDRETIQAEAERLRHLADFYWPTAGGVSTGFGYRIHPILRVKRLHNGADIGGKCGQPIWATQSGTVTKVAPSGYNGGSGHNVRIDHGDINGDSIQTAYLHMSKIEVKVGQKVDKGQRIGTVGTTGLSTGCHLHLTLYKNGRASDPLEYAKK